MKKIVLLSLVISSCHAKIYDSRRYNNHTQAVTAVAFDKEGRSIITGSLDGSMCKRGWGQAYEGKTVEGLGPVTHLKRIEKFLAVVHEKCNCGATIAEHPHPEFYNIDDLAYRSSGALRQGGHSKPIADMHIINAKSMVTVDQEGKLVFLYNCMRSVVMDEKLNINRLAVASPSRIIGISGQGNALHYFDPEVRSLVMVKRLALEKITTLTALKHYLLAFTTQDKGVMLLNGKTGADIAQKLGEHHQEIVAINKINKRLFVTADKGGVVKVWNAKAGAIELELKHDESYLKTNEKSPVTALAVHWNKRKQEGKIAIGHQNGVTVVWKYDLEK
jgi:WD40 repeat protein